MALCLVLLYSNYSNAQVDPTTGNLINYGTSPTDTTSTWNNGVYVDQLTCWAGGQSGNCGPNPSVRPGGNINFSYGTADLNQVIDINKALAFAGNGVQVSGFKYSLTAKNGNGWDNGMQDYLAAYVKFYGSGGNEVLNYDYSQYTNQKYNWTNFNFNETFTSPIIASTLSTAKVGMIGRDNNFWAGTYGPEVYNVSFSLKYKVDPCALNPAFSPTCAGFNDLITSINVVPYPTGTATPNNPLNNTFPIATVLASSGSGLILHGFRYGFTYELGAGSYGCTATNQDGSCSWWMTQPASAMVKADIRNNLNQSLYSQTHTFSGTNSGPQEMNYQYLFPQSTNTSLMGNFNFTASASGLGSSVSNMYSKLIVTNDPCIANPLANNTCTGYQEALDKLLGTNKTDYATTGYTEPASVTSGTSSNTAQTFTTSPTGSVVEVAPASTTSTASSSGSSSTASSAPVTSASPTANNPQPKVGEVTIAGSQSKSSSSGPSMSMVMSILSKESDRVSNVEKSAVAAAVADAQAAGAQATQQAEAVAGALTASSVASSMTQTSVSGSSTRTVQQNSAGSFAIQGGSQSNAVSMSALKPYTPPVVEAVNINTAPSFEVVKIGPAVMNQVTVSQPQVTTQTLVAPQQPVVVQSQVYQAPVQLAMQSPVNYSLTSSSTVNFEPTKKQDTFAVTEVEVVKTEGIKMGTRSTLNDYLNEKPFISLMGLEPTQDGMVKRNVQPNEVAGGVDIATMAVQPKGYDAYAQMTLKDAAFYKVEAIYKDQRTVDNQRTLRGLQGGSDRLHQEMVNQQYKIGN